MFLRSVWNSRHGNCVNPCDVMSEKSSGFALGLFTHYVHSDQRNFYGMFFKLNAISHCVEFDKLNAMDIAWIFWWLVIFTGNYVPKIYLLSLKCLECNELTYHTFFNCQNSIWRFPWTRSIWEMQRVDKGDNKLHQTHVCIALECSFILPDVIPLDGNVLITSAQLMM